MGMCRSYIDYEARTEVLYKPFNLETHKEVFVNYLEVVILEDGTIEYAVPSHQEKLIQIALRMELFESRSELQYACPQEYYCDYMTWLSNITRAIPVWNMYYIGIPNQKQMNVLKKLKLNGLYKGVLKDA